MPRSQEGEEEVSVMTDSSEPKKKKQGSSEAAVIRSKGENPLSAQPQEEEDEEAAGSTTARPSQCLHGGVRRNRAHQHHERKLQRAKKAPRTTTQKTRKKQKRIRQMSADAKARAKECERRTKLVGELEEVIDELWRWTGRKKRGWSLDELWTAEGKLEKEKWEKEKREKAAEREKAEQEKEDVCPICLDGPFDPMKLPCGHRFCSSCMVEQILSTGKDRSHSCPTCRMTLREAPVVVPEQPTDHQLDQFWSPGVIETEGEEETQGGDVTMDADPSEEMEDEAPLMQTIDGYLASVLGEGIFDSEI